MQQQNTKKQNILAAGCHVIYDKGYNATGIQDIVNAAGIPKGSFYNYFKSKEQFAVDAVEFMADQYVARFEAVLANENKPPLQRIMQFFTEMADMFAETDYRRGCFIGNICQEMADHSPQISQQSERQFQRFNRVLATCLDEAKQAGDLDPCCDVQVLALFIFNSWEGALLRMKSSNSAVPLDAFTQVLEQAILR